MTSSESEGQPPPRKRSRTGTGGDDSGSKKARGRPRVDTQDATAADRRRTQIRLAQRAYRQRKETTISSLKQQNAQLQSIIEQMNKSFLRFNDSALKSGLVHLNPSLAHELKHTTETFVSLAKSAAEGNHEGGEEDSEVPLDPAAELHKAATSTREQTNVSSVPQHTDIGWGYALDHSPSPTSRSPSNNDILNQNTYLESLPNSRYEATKDSSLIRARPRLTVGQIIDQSRTQTNSPDNQSALPFGLVDFIMRDHNPYSSTNPNIFSVNVPTPAITPPITRLSTPPLLPSLTAKTLKPTWTYSHDETTFARRLTRAALETGFHLLSAANLRPAALNHVFKLSLPYMTLDAMRDRFKTLLARGTDEELDFWETPFIHLGGAGTHYPRKDAQGNIVPIPNAWTVRSIGPPTAKMLRAENAEDPSKSHDLNIDLTGFEGEWFDAYDVQGYLEQEKGCHIDPKDSFAEAFIEVDAEENNNMGHLVYSKNANLNLNLDFSDLRSKVFSSESPGLSHATSSVDSLSSQSTPPTTTTSDPVFVQSDAPFGLDMGMNNAFNFSKFPEADASALFDQPLGLDLAPGFSTSLNSNMAGFSVTDFADIGNLGLDLIGGEAERLPIIKRKRKKKVWIDVTRLIEEIIKHGVCLGRAPGFRRKDVDMAFQAALMQS